MARAPDDKVGMGEHVDASWRRFWGENGGMLVWSTPEAKRGDASWRRATMGCVSLRAHLNLFITVHPNASIQYHGRICKYQTIRHKQALNDASSIEVRCDHGGTASHHGMGREF